jgi:hypothetical protein
VHLRLIELSRDALYLGHVYRLIWRLFHDLASIAKEIADSVLA